MLVSDALCYLLLTIAVTATSVGGQNVKQELGERKNEKRNKREAAVLIDSFPTSTYKARPDVVYQKVSRRKYRKPKPKYGPPKPKYGPPKSKYGPPKPKYGPPPPHKSRKPVKKYRRKPLRANKYTGRIPISKYGPVKKPKQTQYGPPKSMHPQPKPFYAPEPVGFGEPAGFGEPPKDFAQEYVQPLQQNYAEPPVDSYGVPLKAAASFPSAESFKDIANFDNFDNFGQQYQSYQSYKQDLNVDNINAYSKNNPTYIKPEAEQFNDESQPKYEDFNLDSYADVYKNNFFTDFNSDLGKQKQRFHFPHHNNIHKNKPWKSNLRAEVDSNEHIMVGGQYAEPPGRLVPNFQPSAPMFPGEDNFGPPNSYLDSEVAASATISPYVNYKHSNMAFSPQNLNDAFSILN